MSKHAQFTITSTISITARLLILILLASILTSCGTVLQTSMPVATSNAITPTVHYPITATLTLESSNAVTSEFSFADISVESSTAVEDLQKLREMFETNQDIDNIVLAPDQVFSDFYNKVIPKETDLRFNPSDSKLYNIGEPIYYDKDADVQATLLGGFTTDNGAYLLLGTENIATRDRSIVPFQFTFGSEDPWSTVGVKNESSGRMNYSVDPLVFIHATDLMNLIKENFGKNIAMQIHLFGYPLPPSLPEVSRVAYERFFLEERFLSNSLFITDPLSIDKTNLLESPWNRVFVY